MTKEAQSKINMEVKDVMKKINKSNLWKYGSKALRSCSAEVYETDKFYVLRSYRTIVACIEKETGKLFDGLRYVYGYTATSAQHISKFAEDYNASKVLTYKAV